MSSQSATSRSAIISQSSSMKELLAATSGQWIFYTSGNWRCMRLPFMQACSGSFAAGKYQLPMEFKSTVFAQIANGDGTYELRVIKQGTTAINLTKSASVQIVELTLTGS
jgi:hypothetical protein